MGCEARDVGKTQAPPPPALPSALSARPLAAPSAPAAHAGVFRVHFDESAHASHRAIADTLFRSGRLRELVEVLNREVALPVDITIRFADEEGPLYDPERREIVFDYAFVEKTAHRLDGADYAEKPGDLRAFVVQVVEFVIYHEVGHVLIDLFDLPVLGREEDAVDTIATLLLLSLVPNGNRVALTAADLHAIESQAQEDLRPADFWSEHLLGVQRIAHIVCLVYGSDPRAHAPLMGRHPALRDHADECIEDFAAQRRAWKRLLAPHLRRPMP
jgi:hypothetical protein